MGAVDKGNAGGGEEQMSDAIIAAIVSAGLALVGTIITVVKTNQTTLAALDKKSALSDAKLESELKQHQAVTETKIDELTKKVEKHNNLIERVFKLEGRMDEAEHNIDELKGA